MKKFRSQRKRMKVCMGDKMEISEENFRKMSELWCLWNIREITGDEFAYEFWKLFKKEVTIVWDEWNVERIELRKKEDLISIS